MIIDDFNTGPHRATIMTGEDRDTQSGTGILGGLRNTWIGFLLSPHGTATTIDVGTAGLIVSTGARASHTLELLYGKRKWTIETPLNLDLRPFRALRLRFDGSNDLPLGFNIYLITEAPTGPAQFHWATHISPSRDVEIPLADLTRRGAGADLSNIDYIWMIFNSLLGANDYAIQSFEAI